MRCCGGWLMIRSWVHPLAKPSPMHANDIFVSAASGWEVATKKALGKLRAPDNLEGAGRGERLHLAFQLLSAMRNGQASSHCCTEIRFDRMLIAQAQIEDLVLITADERIKRYDVRVLAA